MIETMRVLLSAFKNQQITFKKFFKNLLTNDILGVIMVMLIERDI